MPTLTDLSHLQIAVDTLLGTYGVLWAVSAGCAWLLDRLAATRETSR